ncbi:hypothetical protein NPIL_208361 [Nephila pilipes]|uniref:Uncharacterized protein n=1 Tax=Nephila pilipes TaxID=299642 RepID=A0A8X6TI04_NEPPI|nr:hypothetical protein NPIL_208361 [Nephila pilipes]
MGPLFVVNRVKKCAFTRSTMGQLLVVLWRQWTKGGLYLCSACAGIVSDVRTLDSGGLTKAICLVSFVLVLKSFLKCERQTEAVTIVKGSDRVRVTSKKCFTSLFVESLF